jgi:hypothetical protein
MVVDMVVVQDPRMCANVIELIDKDFPLSTPPCAAEHPT